MSEFALFWIILAVVLGIIEAGTVNLVTIWFAVGALAAFITSLITESFLIQLSVFTVVSVICLVITRPLIKKFVREKSVPTNADRIIGAEAVVTENIDEISGTGPIKVMGQIWSARTENGEPIEKGKSVIIRRIEGVRAVVEKKD